jgi:hypothetical protein
MRATARLSFEGVKPSVRSGTVATISNSAMAEMSVHLDTIQLSLRPDSSATLYEGSKNTVFTSAPRAASSILAE